MSGIGPIIPHLWFDTEAVAAAKRYARILPDTHIDHVGLLHDTPSGDVEFVSFRVAGQPFMGISAGPHFTKNPSISFMLNHDPSQDPKARANLDKRWAALADGGEVLMELGEYPFSKRYGWLQDRYGVSWQFILSDPAGEPRPFVVPSLLFTQGQAGHAEQAIDQYVSLFPRSRRGATVHYPAGAAPNDEGTLMFGDFQLCGQWFAAMDSADAHAFRFNEGVSLLVECATQAEIDRLWKALSAVPEAEQCGWLKDRFGVSWQITPAFLQKSMREGTPEQIARVTKAFLPMKKLELAPLQAAFAGKK